MNNKGKKGFIGALAMFLALMCVGCGGGPDEGRTPSANNVQINFVISDGGLGDQWLRDANERFMETYAEKDYGNGKVGVFCDVTPTAPSSANMGTDGYHVYFFQRTEKVSGIAAQGNALDITDIVTEKYDERDGKAISIEDKISPEYRNFNKSQDGKYYAIPYAEVYGGLTYDKKLFDTYGLYFAKPDTTQTLNISSTLFGTSYELIMPGDNASKSCGPDGEYGTTDDGLPSSLYELLALCEYMKGSLNIAPFVLSGKYLNYYNFFMDGLMTSLQGYERALTKYSLTGEIEVVTGYTNENLIGNVNYLKKPTTKVINVTEETGYYTTRTVEQYYAEAITEILYNEGYFTSSLDDTTSTHLMAQEEFIHSDYNNNQRIAMLIEGSHWYNESEIRGNFDSFYLMNTDVTDREIAWMPLPVNIANSVTGEDGLATVNGITEWVKGEAPTLIDTNRSAIVINKKVGEDSSLYEAVKDWIQFFNSETELSKFSLSSGMARPLNYQMTEEDRAEMNHFAGSIWDVRSRANVLRYEGNNDTFKNNYGWFASGFEEQLFVCCHKLTFFDCIKKGHSQANRAFGALGCFESSMVTKDGWSAIYRGNGTIGEIEGADYVR